MRPVTRYLGVLVLLSGIARAEEFKAIVDDVVTPKVVAIKIQSGAVPSGTELVARRGGSEVARLKLKTVSGICRVLSGSAQKGDIVSLAPQAGRPSEPGTQSATTRSQDARNSYRYSGNDPTEKSLLQAEGALLFADHLLKTLPANGGDRTKALSKDVPDRLERVRLAGALMNEGTAKDRVRGALTDLGATVLAGRVGERQSQTPSSPILPDASEPYPVHPFGSQPMLTPDLSVWRTPSYWGEAPVQANFDGWEFDEKEDRIHPGSDALIRTDVTLGDVSVSGEVNLQSGRSLYLILRSQAVVAFNHEFASSGVSFKSGYDNLSRTTVKGNSPPLERDRWYAFNATIRGAELTVTLDGEAVLKTGISFKTQVKTAERYVGLGSYKGRGAFRKLKISAASTRDKRAFPVFIASNVYVADGLPVTMLADGNAFASLYGPRLQSHRRIHHAVEKGLLTFSGSSYHQFTLNDLAADAFRATGSLKIKDEGNVWFRVNPNLIVGVSAAKKRADRDPDGPAFYLKRKLGNYLSYDQSFSGTPLLPGQWYEWTVDYAHPSLRFSINGEVVAMACIDKKDAPEKDFNHFGISAFNVEAEMKNVIFQRLKPARKEVTIDQVEAMVKEAEGHVSKAIAGLKTKKGADNAVAVLENARPPIRASAEDFIDVAESFRGANDWSTYLSLLEANYKRFPADSPERTANEATWRVAQQKFDVAQSSMEPGDLGLDNVVKLSGKRTAVAAARNGGIWFPLAGNKSLVRLDPTKRAVAQTIPFQGEVTGLADRGKYLIVLSEGGKRFVKLDVTNGRELGRVDVSTGTVIDWATTTGSHLYFSVDENVAGQVVFAKFRIYDLDEATMKFRKTDAFGQTVAIDPYGRYLYSGISVPLTRMIGTFDPSPLRIRPVGPQVDHLLCFQVVGGELSLFSQRAAPGQDGVDLVVSPRGRGVCFLAKKGFPLDHDPTLTGMKVPIFRTGRVDRTVTSLDCGDRPTLMAFNPVRWEAYIYNGTEIITFGLRHHDRLATIRPTPKSVTGSGTDMVVDAHGDRLYLAFSGSPGGIAVINLSDDGEMIFSTPENALARARKLLASGAKDDGLAQLKSLVEETQFSPVGEQAAALWLKELAIDVSDQPAPSLNAKSLETYVNAPVPNDGAPPKRVGATPHRPAMSPAQKIALEDLESFESLAKRYPASWVASCMNALEEHLDDPEITLLLAEGCLTIGSPRAAHDFSQRLLKTTEGKGYYAMRAYGVLAKASVALQDKIHALNQALSLAPGNPFIHRRLGEVYAKANAEALANYHARTSLHLFPSQPAVRARLEKAEVITPRKFPAERDIADLYKTLSPSTVLIRHPQGVGTGFFITRDGLVLTNHHVVNGGETQLTVHLVNADGKKHQFPAVVIATDSRLDVAILSVNLGQLTVDPLELAPADLAQTGMRTIAIGNPGMGAAVLAQTVTEGIISNVSQRVDGQFYIQTSAAVNPGNSGGPLISRHGLVLGMVTLKASLDNVGFAIPVTRLKAFMEKALD